MEFEKAGLTLMTKMTDDLVLQIQRRQSSQMKQSRAMHVEQTSRWR